MAALALTLGFDDDRGCFYHCGGAVAHREGKVFNGLSSHQGHHAIRPARELHLSDQTVPLHGGHDASEASERAALDETDDAGLGREVEGSAGERRTGDDLAPAGVAAAVKQPFGGPAADRVTAHADEARSFANTEMRHGDEYSHVAARMLGRW